MDTLPQNDQAPAPANPELVELAEAMARGDTPGADPGSSGRPGVDEQDPSAGAGSDAGADMHRHAAYGAARAIVDGLCGLAARRWAAAVYTDDEKHIMASLIVPVALKHGTSPWFLKYREEFEAGGFALYMGYLGAQRVAAAAPAAEAPAAPLQPEPHLRS